MRRRLTGLGLVGLLTCVGWAQTQPSGSATDQTPQSLADRSPSANVRAAAVRERAPGNIIRDALARHRGLINDRITAARAGQGAADNSSASTGTGGTTPSPTTSTPGGSNIIGNLLSSGLLGQLGGGNLTGLLGSLIGNTTGSTGSPSNTGGSTNNTGGTTGTNPNIPPNITPEVIALLQSFGIDINDVFPPPDSSNRQQTRPADNTGPRAQQQNPPAAGNNGNQPKFITRLLDSLLSTVFNALVLGVQTQAFIDSIKNSLRPLFGLDNPTSNSNNTGALRWPAPQPSLPAAAPLPRSALA